MGQRGDLHAAKQSQRAQPPPALELILQAERPPRFELQLAQDDVRLGVRVPDDEDVIDDALGTFLDGERQVDTCVIRARAQRDVDRDGSKPAVEVFDDERVPRIDDARLEIRIASSDLDERPQLVGLDRRRPENPDVADRRLRTFGDDNRGAHVGLSRHRGVGRSAARRFH